MSCNQNSSMTDNEWESLIRESDKRLKIHDAKYGINFDNDDEEED